MIVKMFFPIYIFSPPMVAELQNLSNFWGVTVHKWSTAFLCLTVTYIMLLIK